jgi:hypothetical protein
MSWSVFVCPLHRVAAEGGLDWAAAASFTYGVPDRAPASRPLPLVTDVLSALRSAGCHGTAWFADEDLDASVRLPPCPNPADCATAGGLDLGEVSLQTAHQGESLRADTSVEVVVFRKPSSVAVLHAACALTASAGALLAFDDSADQVFVVSPGDRPEDLITHWPW